MITALDSISQEATADHAAAGRALSRAFVAAWLIAGNPESAGEAVEQGIARWHPAAKPCERGFVREVVQAALELSPESDEAVVESPVAAPELAPELARVLRLPLSLRRPFVLRMLARLPLPACAELLRLSLSDFQQLLTQAITELPFFSA
jgi:hypothetical protein